MACHHNTYNIWYSYLRELSRLQEHESPSPPHKWYNTNGIVSSTFTLTPPRYTHPSPFAFALELSR